MRDAYAGRHFDFDYRLGLGAAYLERAGGKIHSVLLSGDTHRQRQFAGTIGQILNAFRGGTAAAHGGDSSDRFQGANQDTAGLADRLRDEVQAFVHAVDEIDVGVAGLIEHYAGAIGDAAPGMSGAVVDAQVGFHFDDSSGSFSMDEDFAQAVTGDFDDRARVETAG